MNMSAGWKSGALALALCTASLCAHADDQLANVRKAGELVVGTEMQFAPFDFLDNGQQAGFNKDL
jgi:polar amino acid transport system substrate-binding protein